MSTLTEQLRDAVGDVPAVPTVDDIRGRVRERRGRRRALAGAGIVAVITVVAVAVVRWPADDDAQRVITSPGVFSTATNTVLVASDGYDGATFVDLDHRVAVRRPLGDSAGDQPFRLLHIRDDLIVAWGEVRAVPLDGGPARSLSDRDVVFIPAAEPGTLWLYEYNPLGLAWQVDPDGRVLHEVDLHGDDHPVRGVLGGLLLQSGTVVDARTGEHRPLLTGTFEVGDVLGSKVLWNPAGTATVHLTDVSTGTDRSYNVRPVRSPGLFSPDGSRFASVVDGGVAIVTTGTGAQHRVWTDLRDPQVAWSPDGSQLFVVGASYMRDRTTVVRVDVRTSKVEQIELPFGGLMMPLTLRPAEASAMLESPLGSPRRCQPPTVQPTGRTGPCGFRL